MSFFDSVKKAANSAVDSAKKTVADLQAAPTTITCSNPACKKTLDIPPTLFDWTCSNDNCKKSNLRDAKTCVSCNTPRPPLNKPTLQCPHCATVTKVSTSNAEKKMKETAEKTKQVMNEAAASAKASYDHAKAKPDQFNCEHCASLLAVPAAPVWRCAKPDCQFATNRGDTDNCQQCGTTREKPPAMKVLCGVCKLVTKVPSTNFENSVKANYQAAERSTKKIFFDISKQDYVLCPRCNSPIKIPKPKLEENKAAVSAPGSASASASAPAPAPVPTPTPSETSPMDLVCAKCQEKVMVMPNKSAARPSMSVDAPPPQPPSPQPTPPPSQASNPPQQAPNPPPFNS